MLVFCVWKTCTRRKGEQRLGGSWKAPEKIRVTSIGKKCWPSKALIWPVHEAFLPLVTSFLHLSIFFCRNVSGLSKQHQLATLGYLGCNYIMWNTQRTQVLLVFVSFLPYHVLFVLLVDQLLHPDHLNLSCSEHTRKPKFCFLIQAGTTKRSPHVPGAKILGIIASFYITPGYPPTT